VLPFAPPVAVLINHPPVCGSKNVDALIGNTLGPAKAPYPKINGAIARMAITPAPARNGHVGSGVFLFAANTTE